MADEYIKREDAIKAVDNLCHVYYPANKAKLEAIPSADVQEVRHGEWILDDPKQFITHCSNCNWINVHYAWSYCPNCGADMREPEIPIEYYEAGGV